MAQNQFRRNVALIVVLAVFGGAGLLPAQSTRPGWGSIPYNGGVTFRVWAPNADSVYVPGTFNNWSTSATPLSQENSNGIPDGIWSADVAGVTNGAEYKYYINNNGGFWKHDPQSRWVTSAGPASGANDIVYNTTNFNWNGDQFTPPALSNLVVYELHMGTFPASTTPSRFVAATNKIGYLTNLGVNAVEVMPIAEFGNSGDSWGYNPAQMFAVDNSQYGGPDAFKTFVQACHKSGLAVFVDTVHSHYGPDLLDMWNFDGWSGANSIGGGGIYFYESNVNLEITPWGDTRPNFSSNLVCNFIQSNINMWLSEYHVDGFRWDAASAIITANDGSYIPDAGSLLDEVNGMTHTNYTGKISIAEDLYDSFGFDSAWDTSYPYAVTPVLTNTIDANRDMAVIEDAVEYNVRYGGTAGLGRVAFLESHDVVGDLNGGVRLVTAIDPATPNSYRARKLSTLGAAMTFASPGVPMIFQGQEMLENQPFDSGTNVDWSKTNTYSYIVKFYSDLISARRNLNGYTPALEGGQCTMLQVDNNNKVIAFDRWSSGNPSQYAMVIGNFAGTAFTNYAVAFPSSGTWYVHLNSDSTNYGPDYGNVGSSVVIASGNPASARLTIGPYSVLVLSQIPAAPTLTITATNHVLTVSWPSAPTGWLLYSSPSLTGKWSQIPAAQYETNGMTNFLNVTSPSGTLFYQLQKP